MAKYGKVWLSIVFSVHHHPPTMQGSDISLIFIPFYPYFLFGSILFHSTSNKRHGHKAASGCQFERIQTQRSHHLLSDTGLQTLWYTCVTVLRMLSTGIL